MCVIEAREGSWSVSLCSCSQDSAHFHYGDIVLHISRDDLRDLGTAMQSVAEDADHSKHVKKGLVQ